MVILFVERYLNFGGIMIIVKIRGGLGNQLFQYATGLSLASKKNVPLKLDLFGIEKNPVRDFLLNYFNIPYVKATQEEIEKVALSRAKTFDEKMEVVIRGRLPYYLHRVVNEKFNDFDQKLFFAPKDCYLSGYWQSEKYFVMIRDILLQQITLKNPISSNLEKTIQEIKTSNSISLHIRRGDLITDPQTNKDFGVLPLEYYQKAMSLLNSQVSVPHYFIFSDDLDWAKDNLKIPVSATFVEHSSIDNEEIICMKECHHHIIANSSFSWWGAWLGTSSDQINIAPKNWFANPKINPLRICPETWLRI